MKSIKIDLNGKSLLVYVTFFDEEIFNKISEMEKGEFDFGDLCSGFEKKRVHLGRGFDPNWADSTVTLDDQVILNKKPVREFNCDYTEYEIATELKEDYEELYEESLIARGKDIISADEHFFSDAENYKYCSLESVECHESSSAVYFEVEDDFKLPDLRFVLLEIEDATSSLACGICTHTRLENQIFGVKYKDEFHEFFGGFDEGGFNDISWLERTQGGWNDADALIQIIEDRE